MILSRYLWQNYMPYMPTQEALKAEIEKEKLNFYLQHPELKDPDSHSK